MKVAQIIRKIVGGAWRVKDGPSVVYSGSARQRRADRRADERAIRRLDGLGNPDVTRAWTVKLRGHVTAQ